MFAVLPAGSEGMRGFSVNAFAARREFFISGKLPGGTVTE